MKRALNIEEQIELLKNRGVLFDDVEKAKEILLDIGYYRLGFYSFPFEKSFPSKKNRTHNFKANTTFKSIYDLYLFDTKLRRILLNALDRIEVNLRSYITYYVSNYYNNSPTWFVDKNIVDSNFIKTFRGNVYNKLLENPVIKRHHEKYINDKYAPAWKTIEFFTLGNLITLYQAIKDKKVKQEIAAHYGCSLKVFINYLETIRVLRNKCAHGSCIYNIELSKGIKAKPAGINNLDRHNIRGAVCVILYMLGMISVNRKAELSDQIGRLLTTDRELSSNKIINDCTNFSFKFGNSK